jgi:hypothetical protein
MLSKIPHWANGAIPAAMSTLKFKNKEGYTTFDKLNKIYFAGYSVSEHVTVAKVDEILASLNNIDQEDLSSESPRTLGNDDKGIVAFNILAFRLFGQHGSSLYYLYFSLLGLSILAYLVSFFRYPVTLLPLILVLLGFVSYTPMLFFEPQTTSLLALRSFPALSLCATLYFITMYCLIIAKRNIEINSLSFKVSVFYQCFLIFLVIHIRTTAIWQLIAITMPAAGALILVCIRNKEFLSHDVISKIKLNYLCKILVEKKWTRLNILLLVCFLGTFALPIHKVIYSVYQKISYSKMYDFEVYGEIKTRLFYHNIYSGLAFEPHLAELYNIRIDDWSIYDAAGKYMVESGQLDKWQRIIPSCAIHKDLHSCVADPTKLSGQITNWAGYDRIVGEMLINTCSKHFGYCINSIGYKLRWFSEYLLWVTNYSTDFPNYEMFHPLEWGDPMPGIIGPYISGVKANDLHVAIFSKSFVAVACVAIAFFSLRRLCFSFIILGLLCFFSLATVVIGYPAPWANTETVISALGTVDLMLILVFALIKHFCSAMFLFVRRLIMTPPAASNQAY